MGWQTIKQPSDKYCIFSSIVDDIIYYDCERSDIIDIFKEEYGKSSLDNIEHKLSMIDAGQPAYYQFTMSFLEAVQLRNSRHNNSFGSDEVVDTEVVTGTQFKNFFIRELALMGIDIESTYSTGFNE